MTRRSALARVVALPIVAVVGPALVGCSHELKCEDTGNLSADELKMRTEIAAYQDKAPDPAKHCALCQHFTSAGEKACGSCAVVKGPINPNGTCKLWVAKKT